MTSNLRIEFHPMKPPTARFNQSSNLPSDRALVYTRQTIDSDINTSRASVSTPACSHEMWIRHSSRWTTIDIAFVNPRRHRSSYQYIRMPN